jgi:tetratricopeptide (TPR) repeat protein
MSGLDIDTRSDIYSLGVLLYELLAGSTPFDAKELMASGLDAMRKIIREQEPVRPSTRFATLHGEDLTTTAKRRSTDTSKLLHQLRGDLDWIVMKCLEKDRTRRYETANGLAMDIQRHLQNELVVARPPSDLYRFQKLVRRNKLAFIAVGAVTAALIIGLGVATWSFFIEQQALRQAEADRKIAKTEAAKAIAISDFFQQSLRAANPDESKSSDYTVRQLLDDYSTGLEGRFPNQPAVEAAARETIGKAYYRLGIGDKAQAHLERALALNRQLYGEHEQVAATLADCAWASSEQNQTEKAESEARAALEIYRKDGITGQPVLFALWALESTLHMERRYADSVIVGEQALDIARRTPNTELPETAGIIGGLADSKNGQSKFAEAEPLARKAVDMHRRLQGSQHPETGWALVGLGQALEGQNKFDEAERSYREALTIFRRHYRSGHKSLDYARSYLGEVLEAKRDVPGLVALDQTTLADQRSILGENSPAVANTLVSLADHLRVQGKQPEADGALQEAATILFRLREKAPTLRDSEGRDTINAMNGLANSYSAVGRDKEAIFLLGQVCEVNPKDTEASLKLATWQAWFGQDTDYEATRGRLVQQAEGTDQPGTAERAAKAYCLLPSTDAALLAKALTLARRGVELGQNSSFMCWYQLCLGLAENRNGHYAVAEEALAMAEQMAGDHRELQGTARFFRAMCLFQQNRPEEARKLFSQAETEMPPFPKDERKPVVDGKPVSHEVLICWLAYKEAKALIESNAKAGDHPK